MCIWKEKEFASVFALYDTVHFGLYLKFIDISRRNIYKTFLFILDATSILAQTSEWLPSAVT